MNEKMESFGKDGAELVTDEQKEKLLALNEQRKIYFDADTFFPTLARKRAQEILDRFDEKPMDKSAQVIEVTKKQAQDAGKTLEKVPPMSMLQVAAREAGFSSTQLDILRKTIVPKSATDDEIALFIQICGQYRLDPFRKEIFFIKYQSRKEGQYRVVIMTSRDGYLSIAERSGTYDDIESDVVYEGDDFGRYTDDHGVMRVTHNYGDSHGVEPLKNIRGAWAVSYRKDHRAHYEFVRWSEFYKKNDQWDEYPEMMIRKVAESRALKMHYSIAGLTTREEMKFDDNVVGVSDNKGGA